MYDNLLHQVTQQEYAKGEIKFPSGNEHAMRLPIQVQMKSNQTIGDLLRLAIMNSQVSRKLGKSIDFLKPVLFADGKQLPMEMSLGTLNRIHSADRTVLYLEAEHRVCRLCLLSYFKESVIP